MKPLAKTPEISGITFKVDGIHYNINHSYGHYTLRKIVNGSLGAKSELTNKSLEILFSYIASIHRCSSDKVREAYDHVEAAA